MMAAKVTSEIRRTVRVELKNCSIDVSISMVRDCSSWVRVSG
jgi:hypothetical protein